MTAANENEHDDGQTAADTEHDGDDGVTGDSRGGQPSSTEPIVKWSELWWALKAGPNVRRCKAHRRNGNRCAKAAMNGQKVCGTHGGRAAHSLAAARRRLAENADPAVRQLAKIAYDDNVAVETRLKATLALIDRSVGGAKTSVDIEIGTKPIDAILETVSDQMEITSRAAYRRSQGIPDYSDAPPALAGHGSAQSEIVDAEVVREPHVSRVNDRDQAEAPRRFYRQPGEPDGSGIDGYGEPAEPVASGIQHYERAVELNRAAQVHTARRALPPGQSAR
ncbi:hypothetical protein [Mycolicibacterium sp. J2]|uniref:hypothetical protein n=1 Tax=Mycolicibacterium sp. J2 TaxID=2993511 RepID=UPI00224A5B25|nr:hypothetical protein [Mycolicibacterium sp. J2]MCX2714228.1 hypothetical protein [Mycolicibacterium sp. J2]